MTDVGRVLEEARAHVAAGEGAAAIEALDRAVSISGGAAEVILERGRVREVLDDLAGALADVGSVIARVPDLAAAHALHGVVLYRLGRHTEAVAALSKAAEIAPDDARTQYTLGIAHEGRRDMGTAIACYRRALEIDGSFLDARRTLADAYASFGEHEQALVEIDAILSVAPNDAVAHANREAMLDALVRARGGRLLGAAVGCLVSSVLVQAGELVRKGESLFSGKLADLRIESQQGRVTGLVLSLRDPARAAASRDRAFGVTIVGASGRPEEVDLATAASLTLLREGLGVPLTQAAALYLRLVTGEREVSVDDAIACFELTAAGGVPALACRMRPGA